MYTLYCPSHHRFIKHRFVCKIRVDSTIKNPPLFFCMYDTSKIQSFALKGAKLLDKHIFNQIYFSACKGHKRKLFYFFFRAKLPEFLFKI